MGKKSRKSTKKFKNFIDNNDAVLGMPMRLTVSLIIGAAAIFAILTFLINPCLFPSKMIVSVNQMVNVIDVGNSKDFNIDVNVTDMDGRPIIGALVIIKGMGDVGSDKTNVNGKITIPITATLQSGQNENYLDIIVKCGCFETFTQNSMIKVVRG